MIELFGIGFIAGLALAIPVGPMALLLIGTTLRGGLRVGLASGLAMAVVDLSYAVFVFVLGSWLNELLDNWGTALTYVGAAILVFLGGQTIYKNWRAVESLGQHANEPAQPDQVSAAKSFAKFVAATAINPPTALYFLALAATVSKLSASNQPNQISILAAALAFGIGVFIGSGIWQESLVLGAAALRRWLSASVRRWIGVVSGALIILLAARMAVLS